MVSLGTERLDMTIAVYRGRKATKQQQQQQYMIYLDGLIKTFTALSILTVLCQANGTGCGDKTEIIIKNTSVETLRPTQQSNPRTRNVITFERHRRRMVRDAQ